MINSNNAWISELGIQENIRDRWSLNLAYPTPSTAELAAFKNINIFLSKEPIVITSGITVKLGPHIDPYIAYLICCNAYEHGDIELIRRNTSRATKAVVLGGGIGVIASALAKFSGAKTIVYDANPLLIPHIVKTSSLNAVSLDVKHGLITRTKNELVKFHISSEFWSSSTREDTYKKDGVIELTTIPFIDTLMDAESVFIDIEGGEIDLFFDKIPSRLREVFIEIHTPGIGAIEASKLMNRMWEQDFKLIDYIGLTSFWRR